MLALGESAGDGVDQVLLYLFRTENGWMNQCRSRDAGKSDADETAVVLLHFRFVCDFFPCSNRVD